ncbi:hypothetical protein PN499_09520 [Kamptonema animale CS-326]|uniref:hypothetical protein n=1 Tax=Kamptonema animale TaxID=92934 RepID=UPI00232E1254|nr:hypothetical protein [Kamptonema animale]MDB9511418.1 hypothetical protein [Kamptonema animale CS-326]
MLILLWRLFWQHWHQLPRHTWVAWVAIASLSSQLNKFRRFSFDYKIYWLAEVTLLAFWQPKNIEVLRFFYTKVW